MIAPAQHAPQTPGSPGKSDAAKVADAVDTHDSGIRETLESIVIAFVLAFVFRAFIVEAFVIPTGSMAPTLLGQHVHVTCPQCGYNFTAGPWDFPTNNSQTPNGLQKDFEADCPMCRFPIDHDALPLEAGDRILVLKYLYNFLEPERWDVVVFKNPEDPDINYIKRLVGLPGEQILISAGDIYVREPGSDDDAAWKIQAKPDHVQRAVWQPVYHSKYIPLDGGVTQGGAYGEPGDTEPRWTMPWKPAGETSDAWELSSLGPRFTHTPTDDRPGVLRFDFDADWATNRYPYNDSSPRSHHGESHFQDMRVAATVTAERGPLRVALVSSSFDQVFRAVIEPDGRAVLQVAPRPSGRVEDLSALDESWATAATALEPVVLGDGRSHRVELWQADARLSLFVDGKRVPLNAERGDYLALRRVPMDEQDPAQIAAASREPIVAVTVQGGPAILREVDLDRDLYYTDGGQRATREPLEIREDHFFCLGDNSPASKDSRLWNDVNPWVARVAGEDRAQLMGFVPRKLMIGRAFFVYFPAPHRLERRDRLPFIPNFGAMRFIH